jgi:diaminohydroxyphosphoribosylaminopyrimidine deaminase/5-amino-6-(5-phosphoribosylamino)uracil reductase
MQQAVALSLASFDPSSNKKVGCLIVKNGEIVGSGTRQVFIFKVKPYKDICIHAEHMAIIEAGIMAKRATIYCTLEPCMNRHIAEVNALPPPESCCDLIIQAEIERVVYLSKDGYIGHGGEEYLIKNGVKVSRIIL